MKSYYWVRGVSRNVHLMVECGVCVCVCIRYMMVLFLVLPTYVRNLNNLSIENVKCIPSGLQQKWKNKK